MPKLEVGAGTHPTEGYFHVDIRKLPGIAAVCDLRKLPFRDGTFDEVLSKHVIEHFSFRETNALMGEWARVLKPHGILSVSCPNLAFLCEHYARYFRGETKEFVWYGPESDFFGAQDYEYNFHKTGFTYASLFGAFSRADITDIEDLSVIHGEHNKQYNLHLRGRKKR